MRWFFDLFAPIYRWLTNNPMWIGSLTEMLRHLPPGGDRLRVIDIGCGHGNSSRHFVALRPDCDVIGVDFSVVMLTLARRLSRAVPESRLRYVRADAESLPFPNDSADAITAHSLYYMLGSPAKQGAFLQECRRVLRPGGRLILLDPSNDARALDVLGKPYPLRVKAAVVSWHAVSQAHERYTLPQIAARLEQAGFARLLAERATDGYGVLSRGEKPYPDQIVVPDQTVDLVVYDDPQAAIAAMRGSAVFVLIRQTPDRPGWSESPDPVRWQALLIDPPAGRPALIAFSSLPNAVAFMQRAVTDKNSPVVGINKIGKFPRTELSWWGVPVALNPDFTAVARLNPSGKTLHVDPARAITAEE